MISRIRRVFIWVVSLVLIAAFVLAIFYWTSTPRLAEDEVRQIVVTTIQREAPESFLVSGYLDITATVTIENTKYLFPDLFRLNLGTTRSSVRVPGRVSYGFDVRQLTPESVKVTEEGRVEVALPELQVYSVEPDLEAMEVETSVGWARLDISSGRRVEQQAIRSVRDALEHQAAQHITRSVQPRVNTARAIETMLIPILQAAGIEEPHVTIRVGGGMLIEPEG